MWNQWKKLPLLVQWMIAVMSILMTVIIISSLIIIVKRSSIDSMLLKRAEANQKHILAEEFCYDGVTYISLGIHAATIKLNQHSRVILCD